MEMMEELRDILRRTAPTHELTPSEQEEALKLITRAKECLGKLEELL